MPDNDNRVVPTPAASDLPTYTILINGQAIAATYRVMSVEVSHIAHKVPHAELVLLDGDVASESFSVSDAADFMPGNPIEIKAGYHGQEETIFKGIIVKQGIRITKDNASTLNILAKHEVFKMTINRNTQSFKDQKDSDIIEALITVSKDVDATDISHKHLLQPYCSDWDFVNIRAEANGLYVLPKYDVIQVKKPVLDDDVALSLYYGTSILEFEADMDARNCFTEVKTLGWSAADQQIIESAVTNDWSGKEPGNFSSDDAAAAVGNDSLHLVWHGDILQEMLDSVAKASMIRHHLSKVMGRVKCIGFANIWPGDLIALNGVGERYNGKAFVSGVSQSMLEGRWETDIQFGYPNKPYTTMYDDINAKPGLGFTPGIKGLQIGLVVQLESDPLSEYRVLIKLPTQAGAEEALWARVATLDAGKERGTFYRPEINDEVIVGFLDNNPIMPVILGCVHSSKNTAPLEPADANNIKGFYSRSKLRWQMDDDKKEILFDTDAGNKILISEDAQSITIQDQNDNKIIMSQDGIEITSSKDLKIKASGDIKIEGTNVELSANAQFKASGSGGAEVSSSAVTNVKGSIVNIN
jgi:Rhs element Vgr protein